MNHRFQSAPENAADIQTLAELIRALPIGGLLDYATASKAIGRDVRARRHLLDTARATVEQETGAIFEVVRGVGMKRLAAADMPEVGLACIRKIRRTARRGMERLANIRANDLSADEANRLLAYRSQLGAVAMVADGRKSQTLAGEARDTGQAIPAGRVLDILKG